MRDTQQAEIMAPAEIAPGLRAIETPLVRATPESLAGYGQLVADPDHHPIEIVRWPAKGWRQVDVGTGDEGGTTEGIFSFWWKGEVLYGRNDAVGNAYLLGWSQDPAQASEARVDADRSRVLLWHANYHPDGGQLFFPLDATPFVVPLALPGRRSASRSNSSPSISTAAAASTSTPTSGMRACFPWPSAAASSTSRARSMPGSAPTFPRSSAACCRSPCGSPRS